MSVLDMWNELPTGAKWGVGIGGAALVIFIATRKGSSNSQSTNGILQPDVNAGIPLGGDGYNGGSQGGSGQTSGGGTSTNSGGADTPTPAPGGQTGGQVTPPPVQQGDTAIQTAARNTVTQINTYMSTTPYSSIPTKMVAQLHADKSAAVTVLGGTTDDWGIVRNQAGQIDQSLSAKFRDVGAINNYVTSHQGSLSQTDINTLHQQKVAMAASQGWTVSSDGHVFDKTGKPVGKNGMGI